MKRKLKTDLKNLSHIHQVTPLNFAIGSVEKLEGDERSQPEKAKLNSYLHIVSGNFSDMKRKLEATTWKIPLEVTDLNRTIIFRSLYIKERQENIYYKDLSFLYRGLLLFGHTYHVSTFTFGFGRYKKFTS